MKLSVQEKRYLKIKYQSEGLSERDINNRLNYLKEEEKKIAKNLKIKNFKDKKDGTTFKNKFKELCDL